MQLTPGVTIVQGPDGDEISVNGQKGITNNISVDGADFNNPFFGEQRGGQRPAFTFNQDAIKEMVVVADGAAPEFGRSGSGFVNVVTKSGTNTTAGIRALLLQARRRSSTEELRRREVPVRSRTVRRDARRPAPKDRLFYFLAYDEQQFDQTKQLDPSRIEPRVVDLFASLGSPDENGSIARTNDARVFLGKVDCAADAEEPLSPSATTTRGASSRTARSTSIRGAAAPTPSSVISPTPCRAPWRRRSRPRCCTSSGSSSPARIGHVRTTAPTSRASRGRFPTPPSISAAATASASRSSSPSTTTTRACSSWTTCRGSRAATRSRAASSSIASTRCRRSSGLPTAVTSSAALTAFSTTSSSAQLRRVLGRLDQPSPAPAQPARASPARCCCFCSRLASAA